MGIKAGYTANIEKDIKKAMNYLYSILEIDTHNSDSKIIHLLLK